MHIFYTPELVSDSFILNEEESRHCIKVLRLSNGSHINLVDGKGGMFEAEIIDAHPKKTSLRILSKSLEFQKRNHYLHIAIAPTKNSDRLEWFLEKATEIGIDEISPIICDRSERKEIKIDRLNKVITSAMKQSLKAYHPVLNEARSFSDFLESANATQHFIAHCLEDKKTEIREEIKLNSSYIVLIGPEGDFSPAELASSIEKSYIPISLGSSRLRTETAALEACFEINFLNR